MPPSKVCPVVLRNVDGQTSILAFEHPLAGFQLVKGSIEANETLEDATLRELAEESGITSARLTGSFGMWDSEQDNHVWWFGQVATDSTLPDAWEHHTLDGGGLVFKFFWQPLNSPLTQNWHPVYQRAIAFIRNAT